MENVTLIGIDIAKEVFEVRYENHTGRLIKRRTVARRKLISAVEEAPRGATVVMEACGGSNFWGRKFQELGYKVLLIAPQFVKPYRKSQKNDKNDTEAICEAARRPGMRFVSIKSEQALDIQALHRIRERMLHDQTALSNQIRGMFLERGITVPQGINKVKCAIREVLEESDRTTELFRYLLQASLRELESVQAQIKELTAQLEQMAKNLPQCRQFLSLKGIGKINATAAVIVLENPKDYKNGRQFAASLGLVPRQYSSGGKTNLGKITKRGDGYIRKLLIHGARAAARSALRKENNDKLSLWIKSLHARCGMNRTAVALANKTARHMWAIAAGKKPRTESPLEQLPLAA